MSELPSPPANQNDFSPEMRVKVLWALFGISLLVFAAVSADRMFKQSRAPHFAYLAESLLNGQLDNTVKAPNDNDWVTWEDKTYVVFPPVPALLMLPFVAVFGLGFNDVLFTLPFAALNVVLMFQVLWLLRREKLNPLSDRDNLWLTAMFGFGTVHLPCAVIGEVWFSAQIIGVTLTLCYILASFRARHPFWAGLCLVLAFDTRTNLLFTAPYFLLQLFFPRQEDGRFASGGWSEIFRKLAWFALPCAGVGILQGLMNYARFDNPFEFGHSFIGGPAANRIKDHGLFAYHFLEWNLRAMLLHLPVLSEKPPYVGYDPDGLSIFITTPLLVRLFWPQIKPWLYGILWAAAIPGILPPLFYQNSGYVQFGYRFSLDITPYLVMLLAVGRVPMTRTTKILILIGIVVCTVGAVFFKRTGPV